VKTCKSSSVDGSESVTELVEHITHRLGAQQLTVQPDEQQTTAVLTVLARAWTDTSQNTLISASKCNITDTHRPSGQQKWNLKITRIKDEFSLLIL